jgi:hypothetical protein
LLACQTEDEQIMETDPDLWAAEQFIAGADERFLDSSAKTAEELEICGEAVEYPLMWYLSRDVGYITISNTAEWLLVHIVLDPGFVLQKTDLAIKVKKDDSDSYNNYVYPVSHDKEAQEYLYQVPLCDLGGMPESIILTAAARVWKEPGAKPGKLIKVLAKDTDLERKRYLIEYFFQQCDPIDPSCLVDCEFGFGSPSVDVAKSFFFEELGITDWPWGYVHEIKSETLFRLPIKTDNTENGIVVGQVTCMIEGDIAYIYYQMDPGYPMKKTMLYLNSEEPVSGIPCEYDYGREYIDADGSWNPILMDTYVIENINEIRDINGKIFIIAYVDFCE